MKKISTLGIDLAKNSFQFCATDKKGAIVFNKKVSRNKVLQQVLCFAKDSDFLIAMEACGSANYWGRIFRSHGIEVKLIAPQFVKPYVKNNKNDQNDVAAIAEASRRPTMRFVGIKTIEQQDIKAIHNVRESLVKRKTVLSNEIRAMLFEYGFVIPQGINQLKKEVPSILEKNDELSATLIELVRELYHEFLEVISRIGIHDLKLQAIYRGNEICQRIGKVEGIGVVSATAIVASVGDPNLFKNGREFAAWLGLTPRQHSTGGKTNLLGISKHGDKYIRKNLIHGCRTVIRWSSDKIDKRSRWINQKVESRGVNKAAVALANKNARIVWALMARGEEYKKAV